MANVCKREHNVKDTAFRVVFFERLFIGPTRWYANAIRKHVNRCKGDKKRTLDREPGVKKAFNNSYKDPLISDTTHFLYTCTNPNCKTRAQGIFSWQKLYLSLPTVVEQGKLRKKLRNNLFRMSRGKGGADRCAQCGKRRKLFSVTEIRNKWLYILKEQGEHLAHYCEINISEPGKGTIYPTIEGGQYAAKNQHPFKGFVSLKPDPTKAVWHFFLSPVRLGRNALKSLKDSPGNHRKIASKREEAWKKANSKKFIYYDPDLQPWQTTYRLKLHSDRVKKGGIEAVALTDPFSWAVQMADLDYLPILGAKQKLISDSDEQAKAFIAATLMQAMPLKEQGNPPKTTEDKWDIQNETLDVPSGGKGANIAEAWINRYKDSLEHISKEVNSAGARLVFFLRYCLAHRIVEQGAQDGEQELERLSIGLLHWNHILRNLSLSNEGRNYLAWLTGTGPQADIIKATDRIPIKNVINGDQLKGPTAVWKELKDSVTVNIISILSPMIISREKDAARSMVKILSNVNIPAQSLKGSDIMALRDIVVDIPEKSPVFKSYFQSLPDDLNGTSIKKIHKSLVGETVKERLGLLASASHFDKFITLLLAFKVYTEKKKAFETGYDRYGRAKKKIETAVKVSEFLMKHTQTLINLKATDTLKKVHDKITTKGVNVIPTLSSAEYEAYIASRSTSAYKMLHKGSKILAGPVALIIGGAESISEAMQTIDAMQSNDPGAAVGHGLQATAGTLVIAVAVAECSALISGATVASWAGPVGWIAAGVMLLGALIIYLFSKNDLELYANHCFLGKQYGKGDWNDPSGKAWMAGKPYPWLRYTTGSKTKKERHRWSNQRVALLRMISAYSGWTGIGGGATGDIRMGGTVTPGFLSKTSVFTIKIDVTPQGKTTPVETATVKVWPVLMRKTWTQGSGHVYFYGKKYDSRSFGFRASTPKTFTAKKFDWTVKIRLDLDGTGKWYLPASKKFVKIKAPTGWAGNKANSASVT